MSKDNIMKNSLFTKGVIVGFLFFISLLTNRIIAQNYGVQSVDLDFGHFYSGILNLPGQQHRFIFSATGGDRILLYAPLTNDWRVNAKIYSPTGKEIFNNSFYYYGTSPFYLRQSGNYVLTVYGNGDYTGPYAFSVYNIGNQPVLVTNRTNSVIISHSSPIYIFRFNGTAGQRINIKSLSYTSTEANWSLIDPANQTIVMNNIMNSLSTNLLYMSGTYLLIIKADYSLVDPLNFTFTVQDVSEPIVTVSGFNVVKYGNIAANKTNSVSFSALAGTPVYYDSLVLEGSSDIGMQIFNSKGDLVIDRNYFASQDYGPFVLPESGSYSIRIVGNSGGYYRFKLLNLWSNSIPITYGTTNSGTITETNGTVIYGVYATPEKWLYYDSLKREPDNIDLNVLQISFAGNYNYSVWHSYYYDSWYAVDFPETLYFIISTHSGERNIPFKFRVLALNEPPVEDVYLNTVKSNFIAHPRVSQLYRFEVTESNDILINFTSDSWGGEWALWDADGNRLGWGSLNSDWFLKNIKIGKYSITVTSPDSDEMPNIGYTFSLIKITSITNNLIFGYSYTNSITNIGVEHIYSFNGYKGMRIYYDALQNTERTVSVRLVDPNGDVIWQTDDADNDFQIPMTLKQNGVYLLIFGGYTDQVGEYAFRLIDVEQPPASYLTFGTVYSVTNLPNYSYIYRIPIIAKKPLYFDGVNNIHASWAFYDVDDTLICGNSTSSDMEPTPAHSGYGLLVIQSYEPTEFVFRALTPNRITNEISIGTVVSNAFADAGDEFYFTFDVNAGQRLYFDILSQELNDLRVYLSNFDNSQSLWNSFFLNSSQDFATFNKTGKYTLILHNHYDHGVNFQFRILDLAEQPLLTLGSVVSGRLNPATQTHIYRLQARAGQKITFKSLSYSSPKAYWKVIDFKNQTIAWDSINNDLNTVFFPVDSTYALVIEGFDYENETIDYQVIAIDSTEPPVNYNGFGYYSGNINPNEVQYKTLSALAGTPIYIDGLTANNSAYVTFISPDNTTLFSENISQGDEYTGFHILPYSGVYKIEIHANDGGDYAFRILNLNTDIQEIPLDTVISNAFTNAFQTEIYRIPLSGEQRLFYDGIYASQENIHFKLLSPIGEDTLNWYWWGYRDIQSDYGIIRIPFSGSYYLVLINNTELAPEYAFRLLDLSKAALIETGVNYTNTIPSNETAIFQFISPPSTFYFNILSPTGDLYYEHCPAESDYILAGSTDWNDFESKSEIYGTNFLIIHNNKPEDRIASFQIIAPTPERYPLYFGQFYSGILSPGQRHIYTFNGMPLKKLYFDNIEKFRIDVSFANSGGTVFYNSQTDGDIFFITLIENGEHSLIIHNYSEQTIPYSFRLIDIDTVPYVPLDVTNTVVCNIGTHAQLFKLNPMGQKRFYFDSLDFDWVNAYWTVYSLSDTQLGWNYLSGDFEVNNISGSEDLILVINGIETNQYTHLFRIIPGNHAPVFISSDLIIVQEETTLIYTNIVYDPEAPNDRIIFSLSGDVPDGLMINPESGVIIWAPTESQGPSTNIFKITATDDGIPPLSTTIEFKLLVTEVNKPPVLNLPQDITIKEMEKLSVYARAADPDFPENTLTYGLVSAPSGASINPFTGEITWTPTEAQGPSTNIFVVKVTDYNPYSTESNQLSVTNSFVVTVEEINSPPQLPVQTNIVHNELSTLIVTNTAMDSDVPANRLTYRLINPLEGAVISDDGIIAWTPTEAQGPGVYTITTVVIDDGIPPLSDTNSFTVTVAEVNSAPKIGTLVNFTVNPGRTIKFTVPVEDSDLPTNSFTFSIINGPTSANIDQNGLFTWMPGVIYAGTSNYIEISVVDNGEPPLGNTNGFVVLVNDLIPVKIGNVKLLNNIVTLQIIEGNTDLTYILQATDKILPPIIWEDIATNTPSSIPFEFKDIILPTNNVKFYRVRIQF